MNRKLFAAGMAILLTVASAAAAPARASVNLLANPGFEDGGGSYAGWFTFGSGVQLSLPGGDNIMRSGSAASKIYGSFSGCPGAPAFSVGGYGQAFTPAAGTEYELSGFVFVSPADTIPGSDVCSSNRLIAKVVYFNALSGGAEIASNELVVADHTTAPGNWRQFSVAAPVPPGALRVEALMLYLQPGCDPGAAYVDDLSFCQLTPAAAPNLLANPHFNSSLTGWSTFGNVYYDARSYLVRTPAGSAKLFSTFVADSPSGLFQSLAAAPGTAWRMDAWAMTTCRENPINGANDNYMVARIVFRDGGNNEVGSSQVVLADNRSPLGTWKLNAVIAIAPPGTVTVQPYILFISPTLQGGAAWVDDVVFRQVDATGVPETPPAPSLALAQNVPNPFRPGTRIDFALQAAEDVELAVFDLSGRRVATLASGRLDAGPHSVTWDGTMDGGRRAAAGIYHYVLRTPSGRTSRSMVLVD